MKSLGGPSPSTILTCRLAARTLVLILSFGAAFNSAAQQAVNAAVQPSADAATESAPQGAAAGTSVAPAGAAEHHLMTNMDVIDMLKNRLDEATVLSAIQVNESQFDVSPPGLIALKQAGVSNPVIAAMLEATRREHAGKASPPSASAPSIPASVLGDSATAESSSGSRLTTTTYGPASATPPAPAMQAGSFPSSAPMGGLDPQTAARLQAAMQRVQSAGYGSGVSMPSGASMPFGAANSAAAAPALHVFLLAGTERTELSASYAERAMSKLNSGSPNAGGSMLRTLASEGLRFAALGAGPSGMAVMGGASMLRRFIPGIGPSRPTPTITYVWGLPGNHSDRVLASTPAFELRYADIPGIDPDAYEPVLLHLVLTRDNYRLLGATRQKVGREMAMGAGRSAGDWVAEDRVAAKLQKQGRGFFSLRSNTPLASGEYALVLRPVKGYDAKPSGFGGGDQIASAAWDFSTSVAAH